MRTARHHVIPSALRSAGRDFCLVGSLLLGAGAIEAQTLPFVVKSGAELRAGDAKFYFLGANAYYLMESAAVGDTSLVNRVLDDATALGFTVVRTWGFYDSPDSLNPAVIQYRPGAFHESALRGLDYVVYQAGRRGIRLLVPLVNSWDDFGGMNQYVRWRLQYGGPLARRYEGRYTPADQVAVVTGGSGRSYRVAVSETLGHDDFFSDPIIRGWYEQYAAAIVMRTNVYSGVRYRDDPAILGWELANEARSSDASGSLVSTWVTEMSEYLKSVDPKHLVATGEEGFDTITRGYETAAYGDRAWMFDGSAGSSYTANSAAPGIDFAGIHLYSEAWGLPYNAGTAWIQDHVAIAAALVKPLVMGEFGVLQFKAPTYDSWLTTALLDGVAGACVWQLLDSSRSDADGYGVRCPGDDPVCGVLLQNAGRFSQKARSGMLPAPPFTALLPNYPNPFNALTTISYALPFDARVELSVFTVAGQKVCVVAEGFRRAGVWKSLFDARGLASGAYLFRLRVDAPGGGRSFVESGEMILVK